jgi:hypothetical protein
VLQVAFGLAGLDFGTLDDQHECLLFFLSGELTSWLNGGSVRYLE